MRQAVLIWILVTLGMVLGILVDVACKAETLGAISGSVVDAQSWAPIAKATVILVETGETRFTDANGHFAFENVAPGTYQLRAQYKGFADNTIHGVVVRDGATAPATIPLSSIDKKTRADKQDYRTPAPAAQGSVRGGRSSDQVGLSDVLAAPIEVEKGYAESKSANRPDNYLDNNRSSSVRRQPVEPQYHYEVIPPQPQDMFFRDYGTNGFVATRRDPKSTFGADINDASYTLARRYLLEGNMPPSDAIRVQEFVNHFDYGYNPPEEGKFRVFSELAQSPFDRSVTYLKIGIKGREVVESRRKPLRLTAVIDVSGSMGFDIRFEILKQSMRGLIERLDARDRIAIVAYGSYATEVLAPTSGDQMGDILSALYRLNPGGSTFAEAGLQLGYQVANNQYSEGANNLVILLSDGVANVGRTSPDAIMGQIKQYARQGLTLSTFGFGMGNYNDVLLEQLAKQGNGSYAYIDSYEQGEKLFADQLVSTVQTLARDVKIQVEFNPTTVASYRLIGYENKAIPDQKFRDNRQDGGEVKAGHEVTALYELNLNRNWFSSDSRVATVNVRWMNLAQEEVTEMSREISRNGRIVPFNQARPEFRLAVAAARFAEILKGTQYVDGCFNEVMQIARRVENERPSTDTHEFVSLIEQAQSLTIGYGYHREEDD